MPSQVDQEKYEAVREAVIAACPEIMDVSDGCKVRIKVGSSFAGEIFTYQQNALHKQYDEFWTQGDNCGACSFTEPDCEIIGHPIQLAHILRAIKHAGKAATINEKGRIQLSEPHRYTAQNRHAESKGYPVHWVGCDYDLTKSFEDQKPEVYSFLYDILCDVQEKIVEKN